MSFKDNGGPAFPIVYTTVDDVKPGLSLRDYFAAKAMQGYLAADIDTVACTSNDAESVERERQQYADGVAKAAYRFADAMLRERAK